MIIRHEFIFSFDTLYNNLYIEIPCRVDLFRYLLYRVYSISGRSFFGVHSGLLHTLLFILVSMQRFQHSPLAF